MLPAAMSSGRAITVLHLSDLHFGRHHRFEADEGLGSLLDRLRQDLDERRDRDGLRPDLLVVSGDLAEHGQKQEFDRAHRFLQSLARLLELPVRRVVLIPGNHDINWNKSRAYFEDCAGDGVDPVEPYFRKLVFYKQLFDRFYEGEPGITFTEEEPWTFFEHPDLGLVVAGLNSVIAESHRDDDHHGFVGERQLRAFAEKLRPYKERGFFRLGVMHHDPFHRRTPRTEQDFKDLSRLLRPSLNLVLHGDVHEERLQWLYSNVPVFGVGSAAVGVVQRAPEVPNEYEILQIHAAGVRCGLRAYVPDQGRWVGSPRADAEGERWIQEIPVAFERAEALGAAGGPAPATDLERVVESYRQAIARNQGMPTVFDLLGVNEAGESAGGLDFLQVFVPQDAVRAAPPDLLRHPIPGRDVFEDLRESPLQKELQREERDLFGSFFERARPVNELLAAGLTPRLFLLGAPGAGKTALTRWLLLKLCMPGEAMPGMPDGLVPVRVEMRRFDEEHRRAAGEYTFFEHIDREHGERFLSLRGEALRRLAQDGRVYWIFDGLDEVVDKDRRRRYAEMIAGLADTHPGCRVLVTSRIAGAEIARPLLEGAGLATYTLQDFLETQRDRFLDAWHALIFARDPATGRHRRERIARALASTPSLAELCKNPLLCALLAYLNREEDLPQRRHRLYQKVLERMVEHWDANKGLPPGPEAERFDLESKLLFLRHLAWQMMADPVRGTGNAIEQADLEDFAARFCEERWGQAPDAARRTAEALLRQLRERNYVLAFFGGTTYGFAHRTFLNYLAALEAHERFRGRQWELDDLGKVFAAHWRESAWEEALLLICGFLQESSPDHVVRMLQSAPGNDRALVYGSLYEYLAFCIKALGELPRLDRGVPYELARAINDMLVLFIHEGNLRPYDLRSAFPRCAGRWPDVDMLIAATGEAHKDKQSLPAAEYYNYWIAAAGKERRLSVLVEALKQDRLNFNLWYSVAAGLEPWSDIETEAMCRIAEEIDEPRRLDIISSLMFGHEARWSDEARPIRMLRELMHQSKQQPIRTQCAGELLHVGCHTDEALRLLKEFLHNPDDAQSIGAAIILAQSGCADEDVLRVLELHAPHEPACMVWLADLSRMDARIIERLRRTVAHLRTQPDPQGFIDVALAAEFRDFPLVSFTEINERLRLINDLDAKLRALALMRNAPRLCPSSIGEYRSIFDSKLSPEHRNRAIRLLKHVNPEHGGASLIALWLDLMVSNDPEIAIPAAGHVMRTSDNLLLRARARQILLGFLGENQPDGIRLHSARELDLSDPAGREVCKSLARTAREESIRFRAAHHIGDLEALNRLAERASDPAWRKRARHGLEVYGDITFLLNVGRPRRARVRFHDREVGVLEEITVGAGTRFTYFPDYRDAHDARALAPNLPLRPDPYESDTLHPFFANLLPEGPLYDQTARRLGLRRTDRFGMLLRVGGDVMGAVQVLPEEDA